MSHLPLGIRGLSREGPRERAPAEGDRRPRGLREVPRLGREAGASVINGRWRPDRTTAVGNHPAASVVGRTGAVLGAGRASGSGLLWLASGPPAMPRLALPSA